jgi:DNA-3-methyladenine glycosylase II
LSPSRAPSQRTEILMPLRGIGRWTVDCFLLFGLARPDVIPGQDIGIQQAIQRLYQMPQRPTADDVRHMAAQWSPWRSYATYYLWQSLIPLDREPPKAASGSPHRGA